MEGRGKSDSGGEGHVGVTRVGVKVALGVVKVGIVGTDGVEIGVLEVVRVIGM